MRTSAERANRKTARHPEYRTYADERPPANSACSKIAQLSMTVRPTRTPPFITAGKKLIPWLLFFSLCAAAAVYFFSAHPRAEQYLWETTEESKSHLRSFFHGLLSIAHTDRSRPPAASEKHAATYETFQNSFYYGETGPQLSEAIRQAKLLLAANPSDVELKRKLAFLLFINRDYVAARRFYNQILRTFFLTHKKFATLSDDPDSYQIRRSIIELTALHAEHGNEKNFLYHYERTVRATIPGDDYRTRNAGSAVAARIDIAAQLSGEGIYSCQKSIEQLRAILQKHPHHPDAFYHLGLKYVELAHLRDVRGQNTPAALAETAALLQEIMARLFPQHTADKIQRQLNEFRQTAQEAQNALDTYSDLLRWLGGHGVYAGAYSLERPVMEIFTALPRLELALGQFAATLRAELPPFLRIKKILAEAYGHFDELPQPLSFAPADEHALYFIFPQLSHPLPITYFLKDVYREEFESALAQINELLRTLIERGWGRRLRALLVGQGDIAFYRQDFHRARLYYQQALAWSFSSDYSPENFSIHAKIIDALIEIKNYDDGLRYIQHLYAANIPLPARQTLINQLRRIYTARGDHLRLRRLSPPSP
ncbi:MAG: hypothetical protein NC924_00245 [Candidatus Omnitrophica bacterium]|nr:hypothetical protein [Candidatus Omnitrophota bacterium]